LNFAIFLIRKLPFTKAALQSIHEWCNPTQFTMFTYSNPPYRNKSLKAMNEQMGAEGAGYAAQQRALDSLACWKRLFGVDIPLHNQTSPPPT